MTTSRSTSCCGESRHHHITSSSQLTQSTKLKLNPPKKILAPPGTSAGEAIGGFIKTNGMAGFVQKGMLAELTRGTFSRLVKFWVQPIAHEKVFGKKQKDGNPLTKALAGVLATVPEVLVISPLENIKLAEQLDKEKRFTGRGRSTDEDFLSDESRERVSSASSDGL